MKRLILFIEPTSAQLNIFTQFTLPRLGSFILAGLVNRRSQWSARVFIEGRKRFELQAWIAENGRPDVVGIQAIEEFGHGFLVQPRRDHVRNAFVDLAHGRGAGLFKLACEHSELVVVKSVRQRGQLDLGHAEKVPQGSEAVK